jgi:hypothetical protein
VKLIIFRNLFPVIYLFVFFNFTRSRSYLSSDVYPQTHFPHFISGFHVLYTRDVIQILHKAANEAGEQYLIDNWLDDVFYNGVFAAKVMLVDIKKICFLSGKHFPSQRLSIISR